MMPDCLFVRNLMTGFLLAIMLLGCASGRVNREGLKQIAEGHYEEGLEKLEQASKSDPSNLHFRAQLVNQREEVMNRLLVSAASERVAGHVDVAEKLYRRVLGIVPGNERAMAGLGEIAKDRRHVILIDEARNLLKNGELSAALEKLHPVIVENPVNAEMLALKRVIEERLASESLAVPNLQSMYKKPVTLEFKDANLKMVFEVLSRTSGINFIFDKEVRPDLTTTISVKHTSLESMVDLLLRMNQLEKLVLSSNTVLIYPNTPAKTREYQELVVKSFYLSNADVKQTMSMVRTLLKTREIFVDEKLNMMIMRDTPETIRLAEKMIALQDLAEPEVMLEVEVLEVKHSRLLNLGIQYPQQLTLTPLNAAGGASLTLRDLKNLNSSRIGANLGNLTVNAQKTDSDVNLLANPRIRTRNHEKAKIMIGDRVPVITTTSSSTGFVSDSVQYVDVGLKLEVEPTIYLQDDVAIKVSLEVSSIVNQITSKNGTLSYQIGSRNASTVLRLKDGETQVLAGLISDEDRASANKVPGLGDLPLLGRLFASHNDDKQKTEIVLSITPHLIRNLQRPEARAAEFWSGSEATLRTSPLLLSGARPSGGGKQAASQAEDNSLTGNNAVEIDSSKAPTAVGLTWEGPRQVKKNEQFQLALKLKTNGGLRSLPFQVSYDPATLKVVKVNEGEFFKQNGAQTSFVHNVDIAAGKIFVGVTRAGTEAIAGEESVALITFKALGDHPKTEVKLLTATPVGSGDKVPSPEMPDAYAVTIED